MISEPAEFLLTDSLINKPYWKVLKTSILGTKSLSCVGHYSDGILTTVDGVVGALTQSYNIRSVMHTDYLK